MSKIDPIRVEVIGNALHSIAEQMGASIWRTAYSTVVRDSRDCSAALFDLKGQLVTQAEMIPSMLGSMHLSLRRVLTKHFSLDAINEGDVLIMNHPYLGGTHTPDITLFTPIFYKDEIVGFAGSIAHHIDLGSMQAAGIGIMTDLYQEGLLIPPLKLYERGEENETLFEILRNNTRYPKDLLGDLRAQISANSLGVRRTKEILDKYGKRTILECMSRIMDYAEKRVRAEIAKIPPGEYKTVGYLDNDGVELEKPIRFEVTIKVKDNRIIYDFTGTDRQRRGNHNSVPACVMATCYYVTRCVTDPDVPQNEGCYRPVSVVLPKGSVVNPIAPTAVSGKHVLAQKIADILIQGFAPAIPDKIPGGSCASTCNFTIVSKRGVQYEMMGGGFGARKKRDGIDAIQVNMSRCVGLPVEAIETKFPTFIERFELIRDSGGAGKYRGGLGLRRDERMLSPVTLSISSDTEKYPPPGLFGGKTGKGGRKYVNPGAPGQRRIASKAAGVLLKEGDLLSIRTPGSGGYGIPFERNPELVLEDVLNKKVSIEDAKDDYGVIIDPETYELNMEETSKYRTDDNTNET